jgi:hypothetical protein
MAAGGRPRLVFLVGDPADRVAHAFLEPLGVAVGPEPLRGTHLLGRATLSVERSAHGGYAADTGPGAFRTCQFCG